jgi:hypothetical protein
MAHDCKYEADIAVMKDNLKDVREDTKEILAVLKGDNGQGLTTKVALNKQAVNRAWWWLGVLSLSILGIAGWIIRGAMAG